MAEPRRPSDQLRGRRLLVVEDDYIIASELAEIVGPAGSVAGAQALIEAAGDALEEAVLDLNLRSERAYPIAGALRARSVPFVFARGYDAWVIRKHTPTCGAARSRAAWP